MNRKSRFYGRISRENFKLNYFPIFSYKHVELFEYLQFHQCQYSDTIARYLKIIYMHEGENNITPRHFFCRAKCVGLCFFGFVGPVLLEIRYFKLASIRFDKYYLCN